MATSAQQLALQPPRLVHAVLAEIARRGRAAQSDLRRAAADAGHPIGAAAFERGMVIPLLCARWIVGAHAGTATRALDFLLTPGGAAELARLRTELGPG